MKYELDGVYYNNQWYRTDENIHGYIEFADENWTKGEIHLTMYEDVTTYHLTKIDKGTDMTYWSCKDDYQNTTYEIFGKVDPETGHLIIVMGSAGNRGLSFAVEK